MQKAGKKESVNQSIKNQSQAVCNTIMLVLQQYNDELTHGQNSRTIRSTLEHDGVAYPIRLSVKVDPETNVTTVNITNAHPTLRGPFGTNNEIEVKALGMPDRSKPGYDFVTTKDFHDRGELIFQAAREMLKDENGVISETAQSELDSIQRRFTTRINKYCKLDINEMQDTSTRNKYFSKKYLSSQKIFGSTLLNLTKLISEQRDPESKNTSFYRRKDDFKQVLNELQEQEKEIVDARNRPVIMKIDYHTQPQFDAENEEVIRTNNNKPFSMQIPLGDKTLASTNRSGNDPDHLLSNHVRDISGFVDPSQPDSVTVKRVVDSHSSLPTIGEENDSVRRLNALKAAKEKIKTMVIEYLETHEVGEGAVIDIPLSAMVLLTPGIELLDDSIRKLESEFSQLNETRYALEYLRCREFTLEDLGIDAYNATTIKVKPDVSFMNLPVNIHKVFYPAVSSIQDHINARGYNEYVNNVNAYLSDLTNVENPLLIGALDQLEHFSKQRNARTIKRNNQEVSISDLEKIIDRQDELLKEQYNILDNLMNKKDKVANVRGSELDGEIATVFENIDAIQDNLKSEYKLLQAIHMSDDLDEMQSLVDELDKVLKIAHPTNNNSVQSSTTLTAADQETLLLTKRFLEAQILFQTKGYQDPENAYLFQARYLQTNEAIGRTVEAFCKSSEDRTGWLRITLLANEMFVDQYSRDPVMSNRQDRALFKELCVKATELSASIENTKHNSNARGLQIDSAFTDERVAQIGDQVGKMAKRAFEWALENQNKWSRKETLKERASGERPSILRTASGLIRDSREKKRSRSKSKRRNSIDEPSETNTSSEPFSSTESLSESNSEPPSPPESPTISRPENHTSQDSLSEAKSEKQPSAPPKRRQSWLSVSTPSSNAIGQANRYRERPTTRLASRVKPSSNDQFFETVKALSRDHGCVPTSDKGSDNSMFITTKNQHQFLLENSQLGVNIKSNSNKEIQAQDPDSIVRDMIMIADGLGSKSPVKVDIHGGKPHQQFEIFKQFVNEGYFVDNWDRKATVLTLNESQMEKYSDLIEKNQNNQQNFVKASEAQPAPDEPRAMKY